jgi:hypothetical protein
MSITYQIVKDTDVLIPNKEHKNFTTSGEKIESGTIVHGQEKKIEGLRRGEPFVYRMFLTSDNKLIYLKSIKPMNTTEVNLGADGAPTTTVLNLKPAEQAKSNKAKDEVWGLIIGGVVGYIAYHKLHYKKHGKHSLKHGAMYIAGGAAAGYGVGLLFHKHQAATIKPSK